MKTVEIIPQSGYRTSDEASQRRHLDMKPRDASQVPDSVDLKGPRAEVRASFSKCTGQAPMLPVRRLPHQPTRSQSTLPFPAIGSGAYGVCPFSVAYDERFDEDEGEARTFFAMVLVWCDDYGRFEGDVQGFARATGIAAGYVEARFAWLEARGVIERYKAPNRRRLVGEVVGFANMAGQPERRALPKKRGGGRFPDCEGVVPLPRRARSRAQQEAVRERA